MLVWTRLILTFAWGIRTGSVLVPFLFILRISPLSKLVSWSSVGHHLNTDNIQLFISFSLHYLWDELNHPRTPSQRYQPGWTSISYVSTIQKYKILTIGLWTIKPNNWSFGLSPKDLNISVPFTLHVPYSCPVHSLGDKSLTFADHITRCIIHLLLFFSSLSIFAKNLSLKKDADIGALKTCYQKFKEQMSSSLKVRTCAVTWQFSIASVLADVKIVMLWPLSATSFSN